MTFSLSNRTHLQFVLVCVGILFLTGLYAAKHMTSDGAMGGQSLSVMQTRYRAQEELLNDMRKEIGLLKMHNDQPMPVAIISLADQGRGQEHVQVRVKQQQEQRIEEQQVPQPSQQQQQQQHQQQQQPQQQQHQQEQRRQQQQQQDQSFVAPVAMVFPDLEERCSITYEQCQAKLRAHSQTPGKKTLRNLHWVHFPKAGTSFGQTLFSYLCTSTPSAQDSPDEPPPSCPMCGNVKRGVWDRDLYSLLQFQKLPYCDAQSSAKGLLQNHLPVPRSFTRESDSLIALFRDPRRRLQSAFNHGKHSFGIGERDHPTAHLRREYMLQHTHTLKDFAAFPDIQGCQTKMLLSEYCAIDMSITNDDFNKAARILSEFAFVGLTEAYNMSVCLFHHMYGGPLHDFEFSSFRVSEPYAGPEHGLLPGGSLRAPDNTW